MGFKAGVKEKALIACKRYCVLCEMQKGKKIECHHIMPKAKGGDNSFDNCIPLCFDCHEEVGSYNPEHPKGNKYRCKELKTRRDDFYKKVKNGDVAVANHIVPNQESQRQCTSGHGDVPQITLKRFRQFAVEIDSECYTTAGLAKQTPPSNHNTTDCTLDEI